jgi:hypothetical protein
MLTPASIFQPEVLTGAVELRAQEAVVYDLQDFCPIRTVRQRKVKLNIDVGSPGRIGQFRADNALTPIAVPDFKLQTMELEMPMLSEKEVIQEDQLVLLNSPDERIARQVANTIIDNGARLRGRNINLTRLMAWLAIQDLLTITYPNNSAIDVRYLLDNTDGGMSGSHLPTVSVSWANPNADIIGDAKAFNKRIADDYGKRGTEAWLPTEVWEYMQNNIAIQKRFGTTTDPRIPERPEQVAPILGLQRISLYDEIYKDAAGVTQRFLPITKAHFRAVAPAGQQRVCEMLDGPVARYNGRTQRIEVAANPGAQTDIWAAPDPPQEHVRVTTARIPMLVREALLTATVVI